MRILLTGASSFTGYWFAKMLASAGHHVVAPLRQALGSYTSGIRARRVAQLGDFAEIIDNCIFGEERFLEVVSDGSHDLLCHHAARVGDHRSPEFDIVGALAENTRNLRTVLELLAGKGLKGVIYSGSVFEENEGAGSEPRVAFSAYGVSKGLTAAVIRHHCYETGVPCYKFVIPNPFGPLEEPRFCSYLMQTWKAREVANVRTPEYVRDNIHVALLARAYARYVREVGVGTAPAKLNPSGYVESQGAFAGRVAAEMRTRLGLACQIKLANQAAFPEPFMRVNTDPATRYVLEWQETTAWDDLALAYRD